MTNSRDNYVYAIFCTKDPEFLYIGITGSPFKRYKEHTKGMNSAITRHVEMYGEESFIMIVLKGMLTRPEAQGFEAKYMIENYFNYKLANRQFPNMSHLANLKLTDEEYLRIRDTAKRIEEDSKSPSPRCLFSNGVLDLGWSFRYVDRKRLQNAWEEFQKNYKGEAKC